jgi:uncharacterized protein (TIGR02246 family)
MKNAIFTILIYFVTFPFLFAQEDESYEKEYRELIALIDQYSEARDNKDTVLLKSILTSDVDQLVSSGEWRIGINEAIEGMMRSSTANPGDRKLLVEKIRFLNPENAIVDARYEIANADGTDRKMWSTFLAVYMNDTWKITGIRNMLPAN